MEKSTTSVEVTVPPNRGMIADWASDQKAFKGVPWGKAMMWIFLVSDTFVFSIFLISYMTVRFSTKIEWPNPSEVFALHVGHVSVPLLLIAIMTFILITSSSICTTNRCTIFIHGKVTSISYYGKMGPSARYISYTS